MMNDFTKVHDIEYKKNFIFWTVHFGHIAKEFKYTSFWSNKFLNM